MHEILKPETLFERFAYRKQVAGNNRDFLEIKGQKY